MKKVIVFVLMICLCLTGCSYSITGAKAANPDKVEIKYFYNQPCATCNDYGEFLERFNEILSDVKDEYPYDVQAYNTFHESENAVFQKEMKRLGISKETLEGFTGPVLTINGKAYLGTEEIEKNLKEAYLSAGKS